MIEQIESLLYSLFSLSLISSLFMIIYRLKKGPSLADRVVAIDLFIVVLLAAIVVGSIYTDEVIYFDVAIVIAIFGFFGTAVFARFIDSQGKQPQKGNPYNE